MATVFLEEKNHDASVIIKVDYWCNSTLMEEENLLKVDCITELNDGKKNSSTLTRSIRL